MLNFILKHFKINISDANVGKFIYTFTFYLYISEKNIKLVFIDLQFFESRRYLKFMLNTNR